MTTERSVVWTEWGGKIRLAVVLRLRPGGSAWLIAVTGTERPWLPHVRVARKSRAGRALRLTKHTFFYRESAFQAPLENLLPAQGRICRPELFDELTRLMQPLAPADLEAYIAARRK